MPTPRLAILLSLGLLPAALGIAFPQALWGAAAFDALLLVLAFIDLARCPKRRDVAISRAVEDVVSAGAANLARLTLDNLGPTPLSGELADAPPPGCTSSGHRRPFAAPPHGQAVHGYTFNPASRGDHRFGDLHVRLVGPWGLAARQYRFGASRVVKAYPDVQALSRDALAMVRPELETGLARLRRSLGEGRDFESLRAYIPGDDVRIIDWKATAKRGSPIARQYEPERNQTVMLLVDCGRHMVSRQAERTKLDYAVDAALRLARVSLDRGDLVGLCAFGARVHAFLPPRRGRAHLRALVDALYPLQPELVESDYGAAFDLVTARQKRRSLMVTFTDLLDEDSSRVVLERTLHLRPRHLPLVVAAADSAVLQPARAIPATPEQAYQRAAAQTIVRERDRAVAKLRDAGALVVSAAVTELSAAAINEYLEIKERGLL
ncbi:MAG TPA: DUF58 domain-containing protein [Myxococcales bacterium]